MTLLMKIMLSTLQGIGSPFTLTGYQGLKSRVFVINNSLRRVFILNEASGAHCALTLTIMRLSIN